MSVQKIEICSERVAKRIADCAEIPISIISITSPDEFVKFTDNNPNIKNIFRMYFYDIDHDLNPNMQPPKQENFDGLKDFVDTQSQICKVLLVQCEEGVSRSAAVGAAANEYLQLQQKIWGQPQYSPNRLVYRMACAELGIPPINHKD